MNVCVSQYLLLIYKLFMPTATTYQTPKLSLLITSNNNNNNNNNNSEIQLI